MAEEANLYEQERRQKRDKLRELGVDPYGGRVEGVQALKTIKDLYRTEMGHDGGPTVIGAGRIVLKRDMGKLSFLTIRDESGDLQIGLDKKRLGEKEWEIRNLLDLGDQIVATGPLGVTNKGETTIWATGLSMASKALLPPPAKWEGLSDVELRYRQRYVDLFANPEVMKLAKLRIRIIDEIRSFLKARGFDEVETPMLQVLHGGAAARPFETHHRALDMNLFMRIAPELYLKRLLVGGMSKVFEINRNFRNEGISPRHNPEFTMLEAYEAFGSWETMADLVEQMIKTVAQRVLGSLSIARAPGFVLRGRPAHIHLDGQWSRISMVDLVDRETNWRFTKQRIEENQAALTTVCEKRLQRVRESAEDSLAHARERGNEQDAATWEQSVLQLHPGGKQADGVMKEFERALRAKAHSAEQLVEAYEKLVEPWLIDPTFVTHVPSVIVPLARESKEDPYFADVYELAINGQEISPGYTELNDPEVQEKHFRHQVGDEAERQKVDEDFLNALKYGMPPAGGMGLGVDRLIMMLTGAESIRDVILFPLMRPQS